MSELNVSKIVTSDISLNTLTSIRFPSYTTANLPANQVEGSVVYDSTVKILKVWSGAAGWQAVSAGGTPADTGAGGGWSIVQGADGTNVTGFTTTTMTQYVDSWYLSAGGSGGGGILNYACTGNGAQFHWHTGHNGNSTQWPLYFAINVSNADKGKVLNQIEWRAHVNGIGNVDFFGSNKSISGSTYRNEAEYTYLGRGHFGGSGGGGAECTVKTQTFNPNSYGYKWYMLKLVDNGGSLSYPSTGNLGGWAMYGMRLNKI